MVQASAPAKIILFGEHAVVYGQPAIAAPVSSLRAAVKAENTPPGTGLRLIASDLNQSLPLVVDPLAVDDALALTVRLVLERFSSPPPDLTLTIQSDIPVASGLGSGAAVAAALARALSDSIGQPLSLTQLNEIVYEVEKLHHGTPSGIDNTVIVYEQPVFFIRNQPIERLTIGQPFHLLIGDTGDSALTRVAVADVRRLSDSNPDAIGEILNRIGDIVTRARTAIEAGNVTAIGALMNENHACLQQLTVSSDKLDRLMDAARSAGALGAKLSGGGRGGNMIALTEAHQQDIVREALMLAGAVRVVQTTVQ